MLWEKPWNLTGYSFSSKIVFMNKDISGDRGYWDSVFRESFRNVNYPRSSRGDREKNLMLLNVEMNLARALSSSLRSFG